MSDTQRTFLLACDNPEDAWTETVRLAKVLVRHRIAERYGVSKHRIAGRRGAWAVCLTDRYPELGPPSLLVLRACRDFGLAT
ncbi:hypothetical protein [Streptomyces sp. NPDC088115]|uniref:hypothetical protein n=1 Tax=Streptomyces sp. NPDC088115 TaxID=3365824 RepID=UPI0038307174